MSQYGSLPPPGAYVPPNQGTPPQGYQQQPTPSPYQPAAPGYGAPGHGIKPGGAFGLGQMMNQAVTTGKPMFNKLGKTISSKLGSKPQHGPPQHLQSYQNYQDHSGQQQQPQGYQQQPGQTFSPQPQQQGWNQPPQQQPPNTFTPAQQSPYQQSNYATPASGHSGQSNYFPQQTNQTSNSQPQTPQQPPNPPAFNTAHFEQSGLTMEQYTQGQQQGQFGQGQIPQGQPQAPFQQDQQIQNQYPGQQSGIVGMNNPPQQQNVQSPHMSNVSPETPAPAQPVQPQWGYQQPGHDQLPPAVPQQQPGNPMSPGQSYNSMPSPPVQHEQQQQQWNSIPPVSPQAQGHGQFPPHSISPPPPQHGHIPPQVPPNNGTQLSQPPTPAPQPIPTQSTPTEFIAELPADMGNLSIIESKAQAPDQANPAAQYQAYHPPGQQTSSPSPNFTIPRRSVSASNVPLADPWRFADPVSETPTREFYILADLLFDTLDRNFEPKNTGLLEAPKVLATWVKLPADARPLWSYKSYSAWARMWSIEDIPHLMVPCQPSLTPNWNFNQQSHSPDLKLMTQEPTYRYMYPAYMPALNRAGWYKFFFLEMLQSPEDINDLLTALCSDTYKPGVLNQPDLSKRDTSELTALKTKANEIHSFAIGRVREELWSSMIIDPDVPREHTQPAQPAQPAANTAEPTGEMTPGQMAVQMHKLQLERQFNDNAVRMVLGTGVTFGPAGGYSGGYGSLV